ncbi:MAG: DUF541 domain-containing protein [Acidimicrobiia bacterium]|nr:DUF541 domain-containing protein [Acidimicrobiia bacterium]
MSRILLTVLVVACAATPVAAQAPDPTVVVTAGEGVVTAVPDRAVFTVSAESRGSSPTDVQRRNAEVMTRVQDRLRALQVPSDAVRTTAIDLRMEYDYVDGRQVPRGYVAANSIEVRVDSLDRLGELIDAAVTAGGTSIADVRFDVKDRASLERQAIRLAVEDARARAEAAAAGAGGAIGRVLRIQEDAVVAPPEPAMRLMAAQDAATATPVAPGRIELRARVTLTAAIETR